MLDGFGPGWTLAQSAITAGAGLLGVFAGGWLTARNQQRDRRNAHYVRQLQEFYSPMMGMVAEVKAKNQSQRVVMEAADRIRKEGRQRPSPESTQDLVNVFRYSSAQWLGEIFPVYIKMCTYFTDHMWLAERSTREHYQKLVHVVEIWKRNQSSALTTELCGELSFTEDELIALSVDLEAHFERLRGLVKEK